MFLRIVEMKYKAVGLKCKPSHSKQLGEFKKKLMVLCTSDSHIYNTNSVEDSDMR